MKLLPVSIDRCRRATTKPVKSFSYRYNSLQASGLQDE